VCRPAGRSHRERFGGRHRAATCAPGGPQQTAVIGLEYQHPASRRHRRDACGAFGLPVFPAGCVDTWGSVGDSKTRKTKIARIGRVRGEKRAASPSRLSAMISPPAGKSSLEADGTGPRRWGHRSGDGGRAVRPGRNAPKKDSKDRKGFELYQIVRPRSRFRCPRTRKSIRVGGVWAVTSRRHARSVKFHRLGQQVALLARNCRSRLLVR